mgnify:CR=1 FL=1
MIETYKAKDKVMSYEELISKFNTSLSLENSEQGKYTVSRYQRDLLHIRFLNEEPGVWFLHLKRLYTTYLTIVEANGQRPFSSRYLSSNQLAKRLLVDMGVVDRTEE